ncbi:Protein deglycase DJ-1zDJ-1 [Quaeritorhiza haematococci]|nr:Protein deglycase DJ-1zDJ-1 [Quaeritorhiza haematococci]
MAKRPSALVLVANGSEEMEAVITIDTLRRGKVDVTVAGLTGSQSVECSRKVVLVPDVALSDIKDKTAFDAVILPGGLGGAEAFAKSEEVHALLKSYEANPQKIVAAICAAPIALNAAGVGKGKHITSHPSVKDKLGAYSYKEDRVVVDGNFVTSRGPGTAFEFALKLLEKLCGKETVQEVVAPMLLPFDV